MPKRSKKPDQTGLPSTTPTPPVNNDDNDCQLDEQVFNTPNLHGIPHPLSQQVEVPGPCSPPQSLSPQVGRKWQHTTDEEDNNSDTEDADVHVSKALKVQKKMAHPKAGDYD